MAGLGLRHGLLQRVRVANVAHQVLIGAVVGAGLATAQRDHLIAHVLQAACQYLANEAVSSRE